MRRKPARAQNLLGVVLIGVAFAALASFALAAVLLRPPPTDPDTLCRTDHPLAAHTVILVDSTDKLERRHKRLLEAVVAQERARSAQYDMLTILRLDPRHPQEPRVLFSKCLPRPPEMANPLFENPRMAQQHWDDAFADAMNHAVHSAQSGGAADASPIVEGLRAVVADPDFGAAIAHRRLVLVSDLLENDPGNFSLYARDASYAQWRQHDPHELADLSDIDVRVTTLDRPEAADRQNDARDHFWPSYFDDANAKSVRFDPVP